MTDACRQRRRHDQFPPILHRVARATRPALHRGNFPTVADLIVAIQRFIDAWNDRCEPFTWTKDPDTVIAKAKATDPRRRKTQASSVTEHWPNS
ncbi:hypothetical protein [Geodermatophilus sp. URMC 62]|uniref:hypothetical protein n=1 Tax=Geodermatophilus sp. URMC 62 TaxID=3423414 RepID=UPI00406C01FD